MNFLIKIPIFDHILCNGVMPCIYPIAYVCLEPHHFDHIPHGQNSSYKYVLYLSHHVSPFKKIKTMNFLQGLYRFTKYNFYSTALSIICTFTSLLLTCFNRPQIEHSPNSGSVNNSKESSGIFFKISFCF